jgi:hypothetical protein
MVAGALAGCVVHRVLDTNSRRIRTGVGPADLGGCALAARWSRRAAHWAVAPGLLTGGGCRWREDWRREEGGGGTGGGRREEGTAAYLEGGGRPTAAASVSGGSAAVRLAVWRLKQACWLKAH